MKVLIAIDGSPESSLAIDAAAGLCWPAGSAIDVLTVLPTDAQLLGGPWSEMTPLSTEDVRERLRDEAMSMLNEAAALLQGRGVTVMASLREGRAASVIVEAAHEMGADLIVLGARGRGVVERVLLGSVSAEVVDWAHCAVLVARQEWTRRILIGTDGSDEANAAVGFVCDSGLFTGAEVSVVEAVDIDANWWSGFAAGGGYIPTTGFGSVVDDARRRAADTTTSAVDRLRTAGLSATAVVREGPAATAVVDQAAGWGADLVVVGTRGHGLLKRMLLGSTARSVLHHAGMSVLITRGASIGGESREDRETTVLVSSARP
jgi:nucleotide-binding universal stress UspA family protein